MMDYEALARLKQLVTALVAARHYPPGTFRVIVQPGDPGKARVTVATRCEGAGQAVAFAVPLGEPGRYDDLVAEYLAGFLSGA